MRIIIPPRSVWQRLLSRLTEWLPGLPVGQVHSLRGEIARLGADLDFVKRRMATYLGEGVALTWLADESPILVNSNDLGGPMNFIDGGLYESDNLDVLMSYLKPDSIVLDIGANLGFFTLQLARRLNGKGHVHAFEPHPWLHDLARRTLFLNGLGDGVTLHNFALSDQEGTAELRYARHHLGSGAVLRAARRPAADDARFTIVTSKLRRLDDVLPAGTAVDLVKIDVEGHEPEVLSGMKGTIDASPDIVILLEKLQTGAAYATRVRSFLGSLGLDLYGVGVGAQLEPLGEAGFAAWQGYVLAVRPPTRGSLGRRFFTIHPAQLRFPEAAVNPLVSGGSGLRGRRGTVLFYGPYWFLPKGKWSVEVRGRIHGRILLTIQSHFGRHVARRVVLDATTSSDDFEIFHDLANFECVATAASADTAIELESVVFKRRAG